MKYHWILFFGILVSVSAGSRLALAEVVPIDQTAAAKADFLAAKNRAEAAALQKKFTSLQTMIQAQTNKGFAGCLSGLDKDYKVATQWAEAEPNDLRFQFHYYVKLSNEARCEDKIELSKETGELVNSQCLCIFADQTIKNGEFNGAGLFVIRGAGPEKGLEKSKEKPQASASK